MMSNKNSLTYWLVLPITIAPSVLFEGAEKISFYVLCVFMTAELVRQHLSKQSIQTEAKNKKLFLFGAVYEDTSGLFGRTKNLSDASAFSKLTALFYVLLAGISIVGFLAPNSTVVFSFFLLISSLLWTQAKSMSQLRDLLYFVGFQTAAQFALGTSEKSFLLAAWLVSLFYVLHLSFIWEGVQQATVKLRNSVVLAVVILMCYKTFDLLIPFYSRDANTAQNRTYDDDETSSSAGQPQNESSANNEKAGGKKSFGNSDLVDSGMRSLARLKLKSEALGKVDKKDISIDELKIDKLNLPFLKNVQAKTTARARAYGKNSAALENYKKLIESGRKLSAEDIEKLKKMADQLEFEENQINDSSDESQIADAAKNDAENENSADFKKSGTAADGKYDSEEAKKIDELAGALGYDNDKSTTIEEDQSKYLENRRKMSEQVDRLIRKDRRNTLDREQLKLQEFLKNIIINVKKFGLVIGLIIILTVWFSRKKYVEKKQKARDIKNISLPAEVRKTLRQLYRQILSSNLPASEEVLRSFYIVETAFAQIEFGRDESLPPSHFFDTLKKEVPYFAEPAEVPIKLFNKVFYGGKPVNTEDIQQLRGQLKMLLGRLQVI